MSMSEKRYAAALHSCDKICFMDSGIVINLILIYFGAVCLWYSYLTQHSQKFLSRGVRRILHLMSVAVSWWCTCAALYGFCTSVPLAHFFFYGNMIAVDAYIIMLSVYTGSLLKKQAFSYKVVMILGIVFSLIDAVVFGLSGTRDFTVIRGRTSFYMNLTPGVIYHYLYITIYFIYLQSLILLSGYRSKLKRDRLFAWELALANLVLVLFAIPDTVLPLFHIPSIPTSGLGAVFSYLLLCHFTVQDNTFSMSVDNVLDAVYSCPDLGILILDPQGYVNQANPFACEIFKFSDMRPHFSTLIQGNYDQIFKEILAGSEVTERATATASNIPLRIHPIVNNDRFGDMYAIILLIADATVNEVVMEQRLIIDRGREKTERIKKMADQIVETLSSTIDAKDRYTNGHSFRVAKYSLMLGKRLGLSEESLQELEYSALLHDVGKIGIPDYIINKNTVLSNEEYEVIKDHSIIGDHILDHITEIPRIKVGARWHHEWFDGSGYPDGKKGYETDLFARIICVADSYDAMSSNRRYRGYLPQDAVRDEFVKGRGTQFDPDIADLMVEIIDNDVNYELREPEEL